VTSRTEDAMNKPPAGPGNLTEALQKLVAALGAHAATRVLGKVDAVSGRLSDYTEKGGPGLLSAVTGNDGGSGLNNLKDKSPIAGAATAFAKSKLKQGLGKATGGLIGGGDGGGNNGGGGGGGGDKLKVTNIVETIDVGVPIRLAYDQWTQFEDFPSFMKKVESVEQESEEQLNWRAQILWSHRNWESTIHEQVPDKRIVWRSKGAKGYVDGAVTFHELTPELTRIVLILEYHPAGFFEYTGNLWRAQGRRVRLEFKHFARHLMTQAALHPEEIEGWRGEIRDGEVVKDREDDNENEDQDENRDEGDYEADDEYEDEDEDEDEDAEDEAAADQEDDEEEDDGEDEEPDEREQRQARRRSRPRSATARRR
jgi:uncharacterized membrane protein